MAGRKKGSTNASPEQIRTALTQVARLGDAEEAAKRLKMPARTLRHWTVAHAEVFAEVCRVEAREVRERHAASVRRAWANFAEAADIAAEKIKSGEWADAKDFRAFTGTIGDFARSGDHAMRLDAGTPTDIRETRTRAELMDDLSRAARALAEKGIDPLDPAASNTDSTLERH